MFEIFKAKIKEAVFNKDNIIQDLPKIVSKMYSKEILEIHNEFETASIKLLNEANIILNNKPKINENKIDRLSKLGFRSTQEVQIGNKIKKDTQLSEKQINTVNYYQLNYPNYKFITEKQVETICKKYNLVCGDVSLYKGFVPEKNLKEIEQFKLKDVDIIYGRKHYMMDDYEICEKNDYEKPNSTYSHHNYYYKILSDNLKICAPIKDMDTRNMQISQGYKLQNIPDPIVLQPVKEGYLILAKWGPEASDELVINQINN